ncbi:MAG: transposase [Pseudomonadota bacterium]
MSNYRRLFVPGGTYFFTVNLAQRGGHLLTDRVDDLRSAYAEVVADSPFATRGIVVLPDHLHAIWTLPPGDADFPSRWRRIKRGFTLRVGETRGRSASKVSKGESGIWQRRYWERCIRDEAELAMALRYVWGNPVKHGLVERAVDWPFSSLHRDVRAGLMPECGA